MSSAINLIFWLFVVLSPELLGKFGLHEILAIEHASSAQRSPTLFMERFNYLAGQLKLGYFLTALLDV